MSKDKITSIYSKYTLAQLIDIQSRSTSEKNKEVLDDLEELNKRFKLLEDRLYPPDKE
ncbi:hypothetical protein ACQUWN_23015 [Rossellomorea aquimaris]|uniref:hypothetical protein n=1 Tax=Rossellomorea TaxID=2837508 RepID=UPI0016536740|nr:hypothetical protein [Rossellomorea vietnamensis]